MNTLIDNTALHRLNQVFKNANSKTPIRSVDVIALFHMAEHIMFSKKIKFSTFELDQINETSAETIEMLYANDCIEKGNNSILEKVNFTVDKYKNACDKAASAIHSDLIILNEKVLKKWCKIADEATKPLGIRGSQLEKWINIEWSTKDRREQAGTALERKASGSFDYIIGMNDGVYGQLKALTTSFKNSIKVPEISMFLDVFFRVNINQKLGDLESSAYSPSPQRAIITRKSESLFRQAVEKEVEKNVTESSGGYKSSLLKNVLKNEELPLPMFAIHFLRAKKIADPLSLLRAAYELRKSNDMLSCIRRWLWKWEEKYSGNIEEREKAKKELESIEQDLKIDRNKINLFSIFRGSIGADLNPGVSFLPNFDALDDLARKFYLKIKRDRIFLTTVRKEFEFEESLGAEICKMLNFPIIP